MHRKLLGVLRLLSGSSRAKLLKFVNSPYYNESLELSQLLGAVLAYAPDFDGQKMKEEVIYKRLFPDASFDKVVLNRLNSRLFQLVEKFLVAEELRQHPFEAQGLLMGYYLSSGLAPHFESSTRKFKTALSSLPKGHPQRAWYRLMMEEKTAEWEAATDDRSGDINLQAYNEALDHFFLHQKLVLINAMLGRQRVVNCQYDFTWLDQIMAHLSENEYVDWPAIDLYQQVLILQLEPDKLPHYFRLKRSLEQQSKHFLAAEQRAYYSYLESVAKTIFSISDYFEELFSLYQAQLASGALLPEGKLHHTLFKNIVLAGLELGHYVWVEDFIEDYQERISPRSFRTDAYLQNLANLHYYRQEYGKAQQILLQSSPRDIYYKLSQKSLLARIYFENKELDLLAGFLNTFSKFIFDQKKKIAASKVDSYRLFINSCRRLALLLEDSPRSYTSFCANQAISQPDTRVHLQALQRQIAEGPIFYSKKWLLERIELLLGGGS